jgi:hypothetical protein
VFPKIRIISYVEGRSCQFDTGAEGGVKAKRRWSDDDDVPHDYEMHKESNKKGYYVLGFVMRHSPSGDLVTTPEWATYEDSAHNDTDKTLAKFHVDVEVVTPPIMALLIVNQETIVHDGWKVTRELHSKPERVPFFCNRKTKQGVRVVKDRICNLACGEAHTVISLLSGAVYAWGEGVMYIADDRRTKFESDYRRQSSALLTSRSHRPSHVEEVVKMGADSDDESADSDMDPDNNDDESAASLSGSKQIKEEDEDAEGFKHPDFTLMEGETAKHRGAGKVFPRLVFFSSCSSPTLCAVPAFRGFVTL